MNTKARFLVDAFCFCGMGAVIGLCGISIADWRYWALFGAAFVIGLIQWVCGMVEGSE